MSYLGFVKMAFENYPAERNTPISVLEIGVDHGQSTLPILQNLVERFDSFLYIGIDIKINQLVLNQVDNFSNVDVVTKGGAVSPRMALFIQENSLSWLERMSGNIEKSEDPESLKFDLVFVDGDHNYHTVSREMEMLNKLTRPSTIMICDDYNGKYSYRDMFYADNENYSDNNLATQRIDTEKQGVQTAINDFMISHPHWTGFGWKDAEPIIMSRKDFWKPLTSDRVVGQKFSSAKINFERE